MSAHNAGFEQAIWKNIMVELFEAPPILPENWRCTMAAALYRGLPGGLGELSLALGLTEKKDSRGKFLLNELSKPRRATQKYIRDTLGLGTNVVKSMLGAPENHKWPGMFLHPDSKGRRVPHYFNNDPDLMAELGEYCKQDVRAEIEAHSRVCQPDGEWLPPEELETWFLDQEMNRNGVLLDLPNVERAIKIYEKVKARETHRLREITGIPDIKATSRDVFLDWCEIRGFRPDNLQKDYLEGVIKTELPEDVKQALGIRLSIGRAGVLKLYAMLACACRDGKARGLLAYFGASTGRWAGRLLQPQNLARPHPVFEGMDPDTLMAAVEFLDLDLMEFICDGDAVEYLCSAIRAFLIADPGHVLVAGDPTRS